MKTPLDYEVRFYAPHGFTFNIFNIEDMKKAIEKAGYDATAACEGIAEFVNENATRDGDYYIIPHYVPSYLGQDHFANSYLKCAEVDDFGNVELVYEFRGIE